MNFLIGTIVVAASVLGGYAAMGGHLGVLWQPYEALIIVGAAIGAYIIANSNSVIFDTWRAVMSLFRRRTYGKADYLQLLSLLYALFKLAKSKGLIQLEKDIDNPHDSPFFQQFPTVLRSERPLRFLTDYLRLISLGSEKAHELEALMDEEIDTIAREMAQTPKALHVMAEGLPALGIVAAVLGVIKAMGAITEPPEVLGRLIGGALIGTFLGVLLSYGFVGPLATAVRSRRSADLNYYGCMKAGLLAYLNGYPPPICVEYARKVLFADIQPSFYEVEAATTLASARAGRDERSAA